MRTREEIVRDLTDAMKGIAQDKALLILKCAQELAEEKGQRLFELWKQAEEARRG